MHCACGNIVEKAYETTGKCENCFGDAAALLAMVYEKRPKTFALKTEDLLEWPIEDLDLGSKATDALSHNGIIFVRDLVKRSETELKNMRRIGETIVNVAKRKLQKFGLSLRQQS